MERSFGKRKMTVLLLFGLIGQIAWAVENMYFNLFIFNTIEPNLSAITLMVQLSAITATLVTLIAGTISDKLGNRRYFISVGYIIWGITVGAFGFISPVMFEGIFGLEYAAAVRAALITVIIGDCVMTLFGSTANDAAFNAWITENTASGERGKIESILSILPLISMLIVAGGFGILVSAVGDYAPVFLGLGIVIALSGVAGIFVIKDSERLEKNGGLADIIYGFRLSVVRENKKFYITLLVMCIYGIACQIFMPYLIIYMVNYLEFTALEYSLVFGLAIGVGAVINLILGRLSDKCSKAKLLYLASGIFAAGLILMYLMKGMPKTATLILFGISGFVMICGYIYVSALAGAIMRESTPEGEAGKLQGVRMIFSVLIPMLLGPMIGNAINAARKIPLPNAETNPDSMTTLYIPAPEIFLAACIAAVLMFAIIPLLVKQEKHDGKK